MNPIFVAMFIGGALGMLFPKDKKEIPAGETKKLVTPDEPLKEAILPEPIIEEKAAA